MSWTCPIGSRRRRAISFATVKRVVGFAIVAVGVSILFLNVSADVTGGYDGSVMHQADCGSVWQAMFTGENNYGRECHLAAFPHV